MIRGNELDQSHVVEVVEFRMGDDLACLDLLLAASLPRDYAQGHRHARKPRYAILLPGGVGEHTHARTII